MPIRKGRNRSTLNGFLTTYQERKKHISTLNGFLATYQERKKHISTLNGFLTAYQERKKHISTLNGFLIAYQEREKYRSTLNGFLTTCQEREKHRSTLNGFLTAVSIRTFCDKIPGFFHELPRSKYSCSRIYGYWKLSFMRRNTSLLGDWLVGYTCLTHSCLHRGTGMDQDPRRWGVTIRMILALRGAEMRAILIFH